MASKKLSSFLSRVKFLCWMRQPVDNVCNYPDNVHAQRLSASWQKQSVCKLGCKDFNWDAKGRGQLASKQHLYPWLGWEWIGVGWKGGKWNIVNEQVVRPLSACCLPQGSWYVWPAKTTMQEQWQMETTKKKTNTNTKTRTLTITETMGYEGTHYPHCPRYACFHFSLLKFPKPTLGHRWTLLSSFVWAQTLQE